MRMIFTVLSLLSAVFVPAISFGDGMSPSSTMSSGGMEIEKTPLLEKATPRELPKAESKGPSPLPVPQQVSTQAAYFYPGVIAYRNGTWIGGDNLLNLSRNIGLYISIIKSPTDPLEIDEEQLLRDAKKIFAQADIDPIILQAPGQAPLPFFQVQVLLYPVERGYAASCEGRLFESVNMHRMMLDETGVVYQAITWQKSSLIVSPKEKIVERLKVDIEDIVQSFADRYVTFEKIKNTMKK